MQRCYIFHTDPHARGKLQRRAISITKETKWILCYFIFNWLYMWSFRLNSIWVLLKNPYFNCYGTSDHTSWWSPYDNNCSISASKSHCYSNSPTRLWLYLYRFKLSLWSITEQIMGCSNNLALNNTEKDPHWGRTRGNLFFFFWLHTISCTTLNGTRPPAEELQIFGALCSR